MDAQAVLEALKKDGKITEVDILAARGPDEKTKQLTDVLHLLLCNEDQARVYHREGQTTEAWESPAHLYWLSVTYKIIEQVGGVDDAISAVEAVTRLHKKLSPTEKELLWVIEKRGTLHDWLGIHA